MAGAVRPGHDRVTGLRHTGGCHLGRVGPEIIDDGVTGFIRDDLRDLADVLHKTAKLDRSECRRVAQDRFSVSRMVGDHLELYAKLVDEGCPEAMPGHVHAC